VDGSLEFLSQSAMRLKAETDVSSMRNESDAVAHSAWEIFGIYSGVGLGAAPRSGTDQLRYRVDLPWHGSVQHQRTRAAAHDHPVGDMHLVDVTPRSGPGRGPALGGNAGRAGQDSGPGAAGAVRSEGDKHRTGNGGFALLSTTASDRVVDDFVRTPGTTLRDLASARGSGGCNTSSTDTTWYRRRVVNFRDEWV
jgi:hypothetical protein